jgi:hypothetical protein
MFTQSLHELEKASASPAVDIRLITELEAKVKQKIKELGLDSEDTTPKEVYHSLQGLIALHDGFLAKAIGGSTATSAQELLPKIKAAIDKLPVPKSGWVLKRSVARRLLKAAAPKLVMRQLGYKSIDSMLKRENIEELYAATRLIESPSWTEKFIKSYKQLTPSDFEKRDITILLLPSGKWNGLANTAAAAKRNNAICLQELGTVVLLPMPLQQLPGLTITLLPLLLHYINEIRMYNAYLKLQQVNPDFGSKLVQTVLIGSAEAATMAGQPLHWRIVQRHFGHAAGPGHPEIFEPHVQAEDLAWQRAEEILYRLEPALKFWEGLDWVAIGDSNHPVSFNLIDNALNYCNQLPYQKHATHHFRSSLHNELLVRYLGQENLENQALKDLSYEDSELELTEVGNEF